MTSLLLLLASCSEHDPKPSSSGSSFYSADEVAASNATANALSSCGGTGSTGGGGSGSSTGSGSTTSGGSTSTPPPASSGPVAFPLRFSPNGRHLVDQNGVPFLINQASSWGLIQSVPLAEAGDYLDAMKARGFNTVMVSVIMYWTALKGDPPNWQGIPPFNTRWDFSTYNEAYFKHADDVLNLIQARNMLVTLVPVYLGYPGDSNQGWWDEIQSSNNSDAKMRTYGRFLGDRYKNRNNVIWIAGGDYTPERGSTLESRLKNTVEGIIERAPDQLWTGHFSGFPPAPGIYSSEATAFAPYMDIEGYYAFNYPLTHKRNLEYYNKTPAKMFFNMDLSYETEPGGEPHTIRRKAYCGMLMGSAGSSFCAGPTWYKFYEWRNNLETTATRETRYWFELFKSRAWHDLVPDQSHRAVTAGYGSIEFDDYTCVAVTASRGTLIAYLPARRAVTVNMTSISGTQARAWWYDPTTGNATSIGTFPTTGTRQFDPPSGAGWVLVLDDAALNLGEPG